MPCVLCSQFEEAKREAELKLLQLSLSSPEYNYWILQSAQFRSLIEAHRKTCQTCAEDRWQIAS
jgi:hypothetical protein